MRERDEGGLRGERGWEREGETYRAPWIHHRRRRAGLAERASLPPCLAERRQGEEGRGRITGERGAKGGDPPGGV